MSKDRIILHFKGKAMSKSNYKGISKYPSKKTGMHFPILDTRYKNYEKDLRRQARTQLGVGFNPYECNVWVSLIFYFKNKVHTDVCNLPKSIVDSMTGVLWKNDKQVWLDKVYPIYDKSKPEGFDMEVSTVEV